MKFYKRFPGDIIKKTSGLTMAQFGAYDRLIDWCYANEQPIDPDEVYTITHAQTPADRRDVDKVLTKFFTRGEEGYRQERIEEVIAEALPKIAAARENGKKGGRPVGSLKKPTGLISETEDEANAKASQSQTSSLSGKKKRCATTFPCPEDVSEQVWSDWLALRKAKRAPVSATTVEEAQAEAAKACMPFEAFLRVWCVRGTQGLQADWLKPSERQQPTTIETFRQRAARERVEEMSPRIAARAPGAQPITDIFDATEKLTA